MSDRTVSIRYQAVMDAYKAALAEGSIANKAFSKSAGDSVQEIGGHFGMLGSQAAKSLSGVVESMGAVGLGASVLGAGIGVMAIEGVKSFVELSGEVRNFQRISGANAQVSSEWVAISKDVGVSADTTAAGMFRLSRQIETHASTLEDDGVKIVKNQKGQVDLSETLLSVGDAYKAAGAGAAGNAIAFDAFGRSGAALIPILGKSREELEKFIEEAKQHGEILTQGDLDKARQYQLALHDLSEAGAGLARSLGTGLVPVLTDVAEGLTKIVDLTTAVVHGIGWVTANVPLVGGKGSGVSVNPDAANAASTDELLAAYNKLKDFPQLQAQLTEELGKRAPEAANRLSLALQGTAGAAEAAAEAEDKLNKQLDAYVETNIGVDQSVSKYQKDLQDLAATLRDNGNSLDTNTAKGNSNASAMQGMVDSAEKVAKAMLQSGASNNDVVNSLDVMAQRLVDTAAAYGIPSDQANKYADIIRGLSGELQSLADIHVTVVVGVDTAAAEANLQHVQQSILGFMSLANSGFLAPLPDSKVGSGAAPPTPSTAAAAPKASSGPDPVAAYLKAVYDARMQQQAVEDFQWQHGMITNEKYKQLLDQRMASVQTFSDEWRDAWEKYDQVNQSQADADQKASDAAKKAADDRQAAMDKANQQLQKSLSDEADILQKQLDTLTQRRDALFNWADPNQKSTIGWANSTSALTKNILAQTDQLKEWGTLLGSLESQGLSTAAVTLLGLDKGPSSLGTLRQLAKDPSQLAGLNSAAQGELSLANGLAQAQPVQVNVAPSFQVNTYIGNEAFTGPVQTVITQMNEQAELVGARVNGS